MVIGFKCTIKDILHVGYNIAHIQGVMQFLLLYDKLELLLHDLRRKEAEQCLIRRQLGLC